MLRIRFACGGHDFLDSFAVGTAYREALVVHAPAQMVERGRIELPEQFSFPWRQGLRVDRFNVGVGQQREHLQPFGRADALR